MPASQKRSWTLVMHAAEAMWNFASELDTEKKLDGITVAQERVLTFVFHHSPEGVKLKDIAKAVKLSPGAVSQIIESLVQGGFLERTSDPHDRRAINIQITKELQLARNQVMEMLDEKMGSILADRTPDEREAFITVLQKIVEKFSPQRESIRRVAGEMILSMEEFK